MEEALMVAPLRETRCRSLSGRAILTVIMARTALQAAVKGREAAAAAEVGGASVGRVTVTQTCRAAPLIGPRVSIREEGAQTAAAPPRLRVPEPQMARQTPAVACSDASCFSSSVLRLAVHSTVPPRRCGPC